MESELICTLRTDSSFSPNAAVYLKVRGQSTMEYGAHFISRISRKNGMLTFHAFDRMRKTENEFDCSDFKKENEPFGTSALIANLADQLGFGESAYLPSKVTELYYDDIYGKKCREILNLLSENEVGVWYCTNDNRLRFDSFPQSQNSVGIVNGEASKLYIHSVKGPFRGVYGKNTATSEIFSAGDGDNFPNILKIKGKKMSLDIAQSVMTRLAGKCFQAFYCGHVRLYSAVQGASVFLFDGYESGLVSCVTTVYFGGYEVYASAKTSDICEDESDYTDVMGYSVRQRIEESRLYGSTVLTSSGLGFVSKDEAAEAGSFDKAEKYVFSAAKKGITAYSGVMMNKLPQSIQKISDNEVDVVYDSFSMKIRADGSGDTRSNIRWEVTENE